MDLSAVDFTRFIDGQLEAQIPSRRQAWQGEISAIHLDNNFFPPVLIVEFNWLAVWRDFERSGWCNDRDDDPWAIILTHQHIADLGEGKIGFRSKEREEMMILHPRGGYAINRP